MNASAIQTFTTWAQQNVPSPGKDDIGGAPASLIILPGNHQPITKSARDLFSLIAPSMKMFCRGGVVVEIVETPHGKECRVITPSAFRSRIEEYGTVCAYRSGANGERVLKPTHCSEDQAKALLNSREINLLPSLSSIVRCPLLIKNGGQLELLGSGYHPHFGGVFVDAVPIHEVEYEEAIKQLLALLVDFDFQTPADKSRALAMMITPALKLGGLICGSIPIAIVESDLSQSGKTYLLKSIAALYGEIPRMIAQRRGGVGSLDESFAQALVEGKPFILFDNIRGTWDSTYLESFLTAGAAFGARVPNRSEVQVVPSRFFLMMSSNGVETTPDLANRACVVRIRKRHEYSFRKDSDGLDLLSHIRKNQPYYLSCIFSVIKAWFNSASHTLPDNRHDFAEWAGILNCFVQYGFKTGPLLDNHREAQQRVSNKALSFIRSVAIAAKERGLLNIGLSAAELATICHQSQITIPGNKCGDHDHAKRQIGIILGPLFGADNQVVVEDFQITRSEVTTSRESGGDYQAKRYYFRCIEKL